MPRGYKIKVWWAKKRNLRGQGKALKFYVTLNTLIKNKYFFQAELEKKLKAREKKLDDQEVKLFDFEIELGEKNAVAMKMEEILLCGVCLSVPRSQRIPVCSNGHITCQACKG